VKQFRSTGSAVLLLSSLLLAQGCGESATEPINNLVVQTSQTVYDVPAGTTSWRLSGTITNTLDRTLLLDGIARDLLHLEKLVNGTWETVYDPLYTLPDVPAIEVAPSQTRKLSYSVDLRPDRLPGTYRALFGFGYEGGRRGLLVYSNEFELRVAP
jgi:hypothetical protein